MLDTRSPAPARSGAAHARVGATDPRLHASEAPGGPGPERCRIARGTRARLALVATASTLVLCGCTAHMDMTISAAGTYDVTLDMRDTTGSVFTSSTDCSQYADPSLIGATKDATVSAKKIGSAGDDAGVGCEVTITGVAVPEASDAATGSSSALVVREGDLDEVTISGYDTGSELNDSQGATAGATPAATGEAARSTATGASSLNSVVDARVSITFPGAVVDAGGGSVSGTTVTWTDADALSGGVTATGYAVTNEGRSVWDRFSAWIIAGVIVAGLGVGALAWRRHSPRR